jgi:hypothetical protein
MIQDLTPDERRLADLMSEISEKCYSAGWMENIEYVLWDALTSGPRNFGHDTITQDDIDQLLKISGTAKSWIVFDDERDETPIPLNKWQQQFKERVSQNPDILYRRD